MCGAGVQILLATALRRFQQELYDVCARSQGCQVDKLPPTLACSLRISFRHEHRAYHSAMAAYDGELQRRVCSMSCAVNGRACVYE